MGVWGTFCSAILFFFVLADLKLAPGQPQTQGELLSSSLKLQPFPLVLDSCLVLSFLSTARYAEIKTSAKKQLGWVWCKYMYNLSNSARLVKMGNWQVPSQPGIKGKS